MGHLRHAGMDPIEYRSTGGDGYAPAAMPQTATGQVVDHAPPEVETDLGPCVFATRKGTQVDGRLVKHTVAAHVGRGGVDVPAKAWVVFHGRIGDKVFDSRPWTPPSVNIYPNVVEIDAPRVYLPAELADLVRAALGTPGA